MRTTNLATLLALTGAMLAGCGDDEVTPPPSTTQNVVETARGAGGFTTLVAAIEAAGLSATLAGPGPFTVLAPTDGAFAALPAGALDALLADRAALQDVLEYHVIAGEIDAASIRGRTTLTTLQGATLSVRIEGDAVFVGGARVTSADIDASNGIIHVIDAVLTVPAAPRNVVQLAMDTPSLSTLVSAVTAAGLADTLSGPGPFTVFAPTNAAFAALPVGALDALLADRAELTKVLTYHVVAGATSSAQVAAATSLDSLLGPKLAITVTGTTVRIAGARISVVDIQASNGVVHVIDAVLLPPSIVDLAAAEPRLSTLVAAVTAADLVDTLSGPGPFTVFAPVDDAFAALPAAELQRLLRPENRAELASILQLHVVAGQLLAADVVRTSTLTTVSGQTLAVVAAGADVTVAARECWPRTCAPRTASST